MESTLHPLDAIAGNHGMESGHEDTAASDLQHFDATNHSVDTEKDCTLAPRTGRSSTPIPKNLTLSGLATPAIILDTGLRVVWQNKMAVDQIWHRSRTANNGNPTPPVFDILFDPQFQLAVDNWRQWVAFFTRQVSTLVPADELRQHLELMNPRQRDLVSAILESQNTAFEMGNLHSCHLRQIMTSGGIQVFEVTVIDFPEGRLMTFNPPTHSGTQDTRRHSFDIERRYDILRRQPNPIRTAFTVLSACLNDAVALKTELLSDEYCHLMNDLCRKCITTVERYGGALVKHSDNGFSAYFLPHDEFEESTSLNTVKCALALKSQIADMSREWKIRKSWQHEIELNIGIHSDNEYLGILTTSVGENLASFGSALSIADGLSRMSANGQIWTTKTVIDAMPKSVRKQLRFGIQGSVGQSPSAVIYNNFTSTRQLTDGKNFSSKVGNELQNIAVTQIFDMQVPS